MASNGDSMFIEPKGRRLGAKRMWRIPPAIEHEPGEILPGEQVLTEFSGSAAILVWHCLRDISLWACSTRGERAMMFTQSAPRTRTALAASAGFDVEFSLLFNNLIAVLIEPDRLEPAIATELCLRIAKEAENSNLHHTAVAYAQAAANATPGNPRAAIEVGRTALRLGHVSRAESWLLRAVAFARRAQDATSYARACIELARAAELSLRLGLAKTRYGVAVRAARRANQPQLRAEARYGAMRVATELGEIENARRYVSHVLRHRWDAETYPRVILDVVALFIAEGDFARAASTLRAVKENALQQDLQLLAIAFRAHLAAAANQKSKVAEAWHDLMPGLAIAAPSIYSARAAATLTRSMALIGDTKRFSAATDLAERLRRAVFNLGPGPGLNGFNGQPRP